MSVLPARMSWTMYVPSTCRGVGSPGVRDDCEPTVGAGRWTSGALNIGALSPVPLFSLILHLILAFLFTLYRISKTLSGSVSVSRELCFWSSTDKGKKLRRWCYQSYFAGIGEDSQEGFRVWTCSPEATVLTLRVSVLFTRHWGLLLSKMHGMLSRPALWYTLEMCYGWVPYPGTRAWKIRRKQQTAWSNTG